MPCGALFVSTQDVKFYQKGEITVLENRKNDSEYESRRSEDVRKTKILEKFVDKIYAENGIKIIRIEDEEIQKRGVDFVHITENEQRCVDEKFAIKYFDRDLKTFAFELASYNNKNNEGWFISDHILTTYYVILWFRSDEELQNIYSYDLCYIKKEKIKEYLKTVGFCDEVVDDFNKYWANQTHTNPDDTYYEKGDRRYRDLQDGVRIVQSMQYKKESPINVVIPRKKLYKLAELHFTK